MLVHILHHVPFELIGNIGSWVSDRGAEKTETHFYESSHLPPVEKVDLLIIMGGPMSVNAESKFRWLKEEKAFIRDAVERGTPTLGICLGSQLIANAFGAKVKRNHYAEHGWFDVEGVEVPTPHFAFPKRFTPFHSHGETFDLPTGAVHLARSVACEHQAFQLGSERSGCSFTSNRHRKVPAQS